MGDRVWVSPNHFSSLLAIFVTFICPPLYAVPHVPEAESVVWLDDAVIQNSELLHMNHMI